MPLAPVGLRTAGGREVTIALIIIGSLMAYAFLGGYTSGHARRRAIRNCNTCESGYTCKKHQKKGSDPEVIAGVFWPVAIPVIAGVSLASYSTIRQDRKALKHERRMAELEAERRVADAKKFDTAVAMQFLIDNGVKADPKMFDKTSQN